MQRRVGRDDRGPLPQEIARAEHLGRGGEGGQQRRQRAAAGRGGLDGRDEARLEVFAATEQHLPLVGEPAVERPLGQIRPLRYAPEHLLTVSDFAAAEELGTRAAFGSDATTLRTDVLGEYARLAAEGRFSVPVARTFPLDGWPTALELSRSPRARGKLVLRIGRPD